MKKAKKRLEHLAKEKSMRQALSKIDDKWDMIAYLYTYRRIELLLSIILIITLLEILDRTAIVQIVVGWLK